MQSRLLHGEDSLAAVQRENRCSASTGLPHCKSDIHNHSIPRWLAKLVASLAEFTWKTFRLRGSPPLTRLAVQLMGEEVTVNDAKARRELGYVGHISLELGMASL